LEEEHDARVEVEEKLEQMVTRCKHRIRRMRRVVRRLREDDDEEEEEQPKEEKPQEEKPKDAAPMEGKKEEEKPQQETPVVKPTVAIRELPIVAPSPIPASKQAHKFASIIPIADKPTSAPIRRPAISIADKVRALRDLKNEAASRALHEELKKKAALKAVKATAIKKEVVAPRVVKAQAVKAQLKAVARVNEFIHNQKDFADSPEGQAAKEFCLKQGATGNSLKGCMQDMRLSGNTKIAARAVAFTNKAVRINKKRNAETRTCLATGDPHFTNFNGDYFHLQNPAIFTLVKSSDGLFEVQAVEDGKSRRQKVSYMRRVKVKYDGKVYDPNFNQDGLSVTMSGNTVVITASVDYAGTLSGVCGDILPSKNTPKAFLLPSGAVADVDYKKRNWELSGYADTGKLTRWQQAWTPSRVNCLFSSAECNRYTK
jgi:hypothetical protein